ncbi:MAG: DNA-binding protein [Actinobacteria bacterium]|nr:DNA-binding protein [Actinomycetota bacterium]
MRIYPSDDGSAAFVRLERGDDLLERLNAAAAELGMEAATLQIVGAVERLRVAYYRQDTKEYEIHEHDAPHEISGGVGNVSLKDGKPFVHIHVTGSGADGKAVAGHLVDGTRVFLIEAYLRRLAGPPPVRELEEDLGLAVWQ